MVLLGIQPVPIGVEGELCIGGICVGRGYLNRPEETAHALREFQGEVWMHTGDVATMDERVLALARELDIVELLPSVSAVTRELVVQAHEFVDDVLVRLDTGG